MTIQQTYRFFQDRQKLRLIIVVTLFLTFVTNIGLDYLFTLYQNSAFYISESLLFSSFWILFLPLLNIQLKLNEKTNKLWQSVLMIGLFILFHLFLYPLLVWFLSRIFYYHAFSYWQTFNFGLNAYLIKSLIIYGFAFLIFTISKIKIQSPITADIVETKHFLSSIIVSDNIKKVVLSTSDISCFSANSPYVTIYHQSKKYLHTETLKSLETQLDDRQFVRIHKSHIINLQKTISYQSRQNGDYDVSLSDGTFLRVSRNYAKKFKSKIETHTHLSTK